VDVGIDGDVTSVCAAPGVPVVHAKVREGSRSMLSGPALAPDELAAALAAGAAAVQRFAASGAAAGAPPAACVLCIGELGIGNTTAAAAVLSALTGLPPEETCGRGTGECDQGCAAHVKCRVHTLLGSTCGSLF